MLTKEQREEILGSMFLSAVLWNDPLQDLERGLDEKTMEEDWLEFANAKADTVGQLVAATSEEIAKLSEDWYCTCGHISEDEHNRNI